MMSEPKPAPAMACTHCGNPITQVQTGAFRSWRHLDGKMFCGTSPSHIATPAYSR